MRNIFIIGGLLFIIKTVINANSNSSRPYTGPNTLPNLDGDYVDTGGPLVHPQYLPENDGLVSFDDETGLWEDGNGNITTTPPSPINLDPSPNTNLVGANFFISAERAATAEGGWSTDPSDNGNWSSGIAGEGYLIGTMRGITPLTFEAYYGFLPTAEQLKALTHEQALDVYYALFWSKVKGDEILNQYLADIIFDGHLQHRFNARLLQETLNNLGYSPRLSEDNVFGSKTLAAVNWYAVNSPALLYNAFKDRRLRYYDELALEQGQCKQHRGWMNRMRKFVDYGEVSHYNDYSCSQVS